MNLSESGLRLLAAMLLLLAYGLLCGLIWLRQHRLYRRLAQEAASLAQAGQGQSAWLLAFASQTGQAEELARETARLLHAAGEAVHLCALDALDPQMLRAAPRLLLVASTYGEGDAPDNAAAFVAQCMAPSSALAPGSLAHMQFGLLALGDSQYGQFCGFGRSLDNWLKTCGARPWFERIEMDNGSATSLAAWHEQLSQLVSLGEQAPWQAPVFTDWMLVERRQLNAGSAGEPVFHLELQPPAGLQAEQGAALWESGDLVQVCAPQEPQQPRDYSIASIAPDGRVHLLVRQTLRENGTPGLVSGWLTQQAALGQRISLRLRAHRNFRLQENLHRPLVLIGNGTGMAGLRSHLRQRSAQGLGPNWLLFGERNRAHDSLYGQELQDWVASGVLQRLDLAFSRDQPQRIYVQDCLRSAAEHLRQWVDDGAAIYVCGSLQGMAQGVDQVLHEVLGAQAMGQLLRSGRYRRDVY